MSIQMSLLGGQGFSLIVGQIVSVSSVSQLGVVTASVSFKANGTQAITENSSTTVVGNWVNPAFGAGDWEIRATLVSGVTPNTGLLNTWQDFSIDRIWGISRSTVGVSEAVLTFEFRRKGEADPEATLSFNTLSAEKEDIL